MSELRNRVAESALRTIDLETLWSEPPIAIFDLKDHLFQGLVLREKEFRQALQDHNWEQYREKALLVYCSSDAIIPAWAPMLVASRAADFALEVFPGDQNAYLEAKFREAIASLDPAEFEDARVVVKGCSKRSVPPGAYIALLNRLQPVVRTLMFGEPCSTVPVYKRSR